MKGELVRFYTYDVSYEVDMAAAQTLLSEEASFHVPAKGRRGPKNFPFYQPLSVAQPAAASSLGKVRRDAKVFSVGAVSISLTIDIEAGTLADFLPLHEVDLQDLADECVNAVYAQIKPALRKPVEKLSVPEEYTLFLLQQGGNGRPIREWISKHEHEVAGLLIGEQGYQSLSDEEIRESMRLTASYTRDDFFIVDWNSAIAFDPDREWEEVVYVVEVANLQLCELKSYDTILERLLDQAYDDLISFSEKKPLWRAPGAVVSRLQEMLVDLTKTTEEVTNTTKFFGDWHLARVYVACRERFHLKAWDGAVERKLRSLDAMYRRVVTEQSERQILFLESAIVVLFILDVILIFLDVFL